MKYSTNRKHGFSAGGAAWNGDNQYENVATESIL